MVTLRIYLSRSAAYGPDHNAIAAEFPTTRSDKFSLTAILASAVSRVYLAAWIFGAWTCPNPTARADLVPLAMNVVEGGVEISWESDSILAGPPFLHNEFQLESSADLLVWTPAGEPIPGGALDSTSFAHQFLLPLTNAQVFMRLAYRLNLPGADLNGLDLSGTDLRSAILTNANLSGANLSEADLGNADLSGALLTGATLEGASFDGADLGSVDLTGLDLTGVNLSQIQGTPILTRVNADPAGSAAQWAPSIRYNPDGRDMVEDDVDLPARGASTRHAIVVLATNTTVGELNALVAEEGAFIVGSQPRDASIANAMLMLRFPTVSVSELLEVTVRLEADPRVDFAVPDVLAELSSIPNDENGAFGGGHDESCWDVAGSPFPDGFNWHWDAAAEPRGGNWAWEYARVPQMWNFNDAIRKRETGRVVTSVLDGGSPYHPDVYFEGGGEIGPDPAHGVHVAGIIGALYGNGLGIDGVNPFAALAAHTVPAFPATGWGVIQSTRELLDRSPNARIFNSNLGFYWKRSTPFVERTMSELGQLYASLAAAHAGTLFITGAGNNYGEIPAHLSSPASYAGLQLGVPNIIVVESHGPSGGPSAFSNRGGDLQAPGEGIYSADTVNPYAVRCGTSMAAAFVSGVAGYLLAIDPDLTPAQLKEVLLRNGPRVDAFAGALAIDELRGDATVLDMLLDVDDGGLDGNERVRVSLAQPGQSRNFLRVLGPDYLDQDIDQDGGPGDGVIDMADFRWWRDGWIYGNAFPNSLNGSSQNVKLDLNQDRVIDGGLEESQRYPRGDFDGDGVVNDHAADLGILMTSGLWRDPIYEDPLELFSLLDSADFTVSIENALGEEDDFDTAEVAPYDLATQEPIETWSSRRAEVTGEDPVFVMTVPWVSGRRYYVASDPIEIDDDRNVLLRSVGDVELTDSDRGADFAVDLTRLELSAIAEVENPDIRRVDSRPRDEEVAASIPAVNGLENEFPDPTDDLSVPYVGAYSYANDRGVFYTQVRTGWPDPLEGWNSDLERTFTSKVHWQRSFIRVDAPDPTYFVRPIRLRLFGWGLHGRDMNAYAEFKLEIRARGISPVWQTVSHFVAEIAGHKIDFFENGHTFRVVRREAEGGWQSPYFFIYDGEGDDIYGVEFRQPSFRGQISLTGIDLGDSFELRYTLETRGFATIDNYAEAYLGDPFNYGSGVRMEYAGFGELPRVDEVTLDATGGHVRFVALDGFYYILYRGEVPVAVGLTEPGSNVLIDPAPPAGVEAGDYTVDNRPIDQPLDLDRDGIDDVYEMARPSFLNALDDSDAALDSDADGRDNRTEYLQGTDPAVPDNPPATSAELFPGAIFDPGLFVTVVGDVDGDGVADLIGGINDELAVAPGLAAGGFAPVVSSPYPELGSISDYTMADLNGDDVPDIAVSDILQDKVRVMLGDGQAAFTAGDSYSVGAAPIRVTAADVNGDGSPDLITANQTGKSISVLLGNGDGTFEPALETTTGFSTPRDLTLANMNGDSQLDLVVAIQQGSMVAVSPGNGDGTFGPSQDFQTAFDPRRILAGDVNGDGSADIVTSGSLVSVLLGNGDGTLRDRMDYETGEAPGDLVLVDLDSDADLDLVVGHSREEYHAILLNDGGEFVVQTPAFTSAQGDCLLADFNRDGRLDLLSRASNGYFISRGLGDGRFDTRAQASVADMSATAFDVTDVDRDGSVDVLILNATLDTVEVLAGAPGGGFTHAGSIAVGPQVVALVTANLDSGNAPDLAVVTERPANNPGESVNELRVFLGDGSGGFVAQAPVALPDRPYDLLAGDLTGDGLDDLMVILFFADAAAPFMNQGDGTFLAMPLLELGGRPLLPHLVDLSGDNRIDFVTTVLGRGIVVFTAAANGELLEVVQPLPSGAAANSAAVFDHTGDGISDLIGFRVAAGSNGLVCHPGVGDGTFGPEQVLVEPYPAGGLGSVEFADVNGDSRVDLVDGGLILLRNGEGGFDEPQKYHLNGLATRVRDVNGDQAPDLLSILNDSLWVLLNRSGGAGALEHP